MTFDTERATLGRQPVLLCEMDLDRCGHTFGRSAPNLLSDPEDITGAAWTDAGTPVKTANTTVAPDGTTTADTLEDNDGAAYEYIYQTTTNFSKTATHVFSVFIAKDTTGRATRFPLISLTYGGSTTESGNVSIDTATGDIDSVFTVAGTAGIEDYSATYWRVWVAMANDDSANTTLFAYIYPAAGASATWVASTAATGSIIVWGAMVTASDALRTYASGDFGCEAGLVRTATAQAGAAASITLDASANGTDDFYNGMAVYIESGTGAKQERIISDYVGSTKVATVSDNWGTNPDNTSVFRIHDINLPTACYETLETCQDSPNYDNADTWAYEFSNELIPGESYLHCLRQAKLAPTVINPNKGLGVRASITLEFEDFSYHDRLFDPYLANRSYTPEARGTFWAKFIARNRHYAGRPLRVKSGYVAAAGFSAADFQTRSYVIDNITGPDQNGKVKIIAKDILKLAEDKRAVAPAPSTGELVANITAGATSLTVTSGTESEYSGTEYLRIGDEIIYSPIASRSANVFSSLTRAQYETTASTHDAGDSVQACLTLASTNPIDLAYVLLNTYAGIAAADIAVADWVTERDTWYSTSDITTLITEPEGVTSLINELAEQFFFQIWWDEIAQEIKLKAIRPPRSTDTTYPLNDADNLLMQTVRVDRKESERLSRVIFYYNNGNPIEYDESQDFKGLHVQIDATAESMAGYNDIRQRKIWARFVNGGSIAVQTASRTLNRWLNIPRYITFELDAKDLDFWTGDLVDLTTRRIQDETGADVETRAQVLSVEELTADMSGTRYKITALEITYQARYGYIGPDTLNDYDAESAANKARYGFIAPDTAIFTDNEPAYLII